MKKITSRDNQHIKQAISLKSRKYRMREQMFLLEGKTMVSEALQGKHPLARVLVDEAHREEYQDLYEQYSGLEWLEIDSRLFKAIADTETPQGIIAVAPIPTPDFTCLMGQNASLILLDQIADPGNLGTIIRTAWALDIDGILLSDGCTDPFSPKAVRASMGGILNVPVYTSAGEMEIELLKTQGYQVIGSALDASNTIFANDYQKPTVIVIGSEARGISPKIKDCCTSFSRIPINPAVDSLNAAVACAIIIMEVWKQRNSELLC
ncbi:MAG: RNA methyltransferase [Syntrophomonadaceae bacterium]|nr:RNA methyltransferase [Syntrophomonadaceae bacterium]